MAIIIRIFVFSFDRAYRYVINPCDRLLMLLILRFWKRGKGEIAKNILVVIGMTVLTVVSAFVLDALSGLMGMLTMVAYFAFILPFISVSVRRLHDLGKTGWMFLVVFIPFVGGILLLVWFVSDGQAHDNAYGAVPTNTL